MALDDLMGPPGGARERGNNTRRDERKRRIAEDLAEREREEFREQQQARSDPRLALRHLDEVRVTAAAEDSAARAEAVRISDQIRKMSAVEAKFVRRRDHFQAAGERNPVEGRQAAELAGTAERLRLGIETLRKRLATSREMASSQVERTQENLGRIDTARNRLLDAIKSLELVELEEANRARIRALEQSSFDQLSRLGSAYGIASAPEVTAADTQVDVDYHVREVTRLAYEAEALVELQREHLS